MNIGEELRDRVTSQGVFQIISKFGVPKGNVLFLLCTFDERIYYVSENVERLVDVATFPQSFTFHVGVFDPLAACEIDDINFGFAIFNSVLVHNFGFDIDGKNSMRPGAFFVHSGFCDFSIFLALQQQIDCLLISCNCKIVDALDIDSFLRSFSDL